MVQLYVYIFKIYMCTIVIFYRTLGLCRIVSGSREPTEAQISAIWFDKALLD